MNEMLEKAENLLCVNQDPFPDSPEGLAILTLLENALNDKLSADRKVQNMPLASKPNSDGTPYWVGSDVILGELSEPDYKGNFEIRSETICRKLIWSRSLLSEYKKDKNCRYDILRAYLITLFTELKPFIETSISSSSNAASLITEQFKKALSQHIYQKQKITDYAELLSVSPNHLNKCVKKTMGKSAHDLLNEMLLLEAIAFR
jgi:hypothetical protein